MDGDQFNRLLELNEAQTALTLAQNLAQEGRQFLLKQIQLCDGTNPDLVRRWLSDISHSVNDVGPDNIIQFASRTVTGPFRDELERFLTEAILGPPQVLRAAVPWPALKAHLSAQFLRPNEAEALRNEVEHLKQSSFEDITTFMRRFRCVAQSAFPLPRNVDQNRLLIRSLIKGLNSARLARRLIEDGHPETLEQALQQLAEFSGRMDQFALLRQDTETRQVEPMDVSATQPTSSFTKVRTDVTLLQDVQDRLQRLETAASKPPSANQRQAPHFVTDQSAHPRKQQRHSQVRSQPPWSTQRQDFRPPRQQQWTAPQQPSERQHQERQQWSPSQPQNPPDNRICWTCNRRGHISYNCDSPHLSKN